MQEERRRWGRIRMDSLKEEKETGKGTRFASFMLERDWNCNTPTRREIEY
jgi:hypothetical protein